MQDSTENVLLILNIFWTDSKFSLKKGISKMKWFDSSKIKLVLIGFVIDIMIAGLASANSGSGAIEITILYDNYTLTEGCTADWGFS